MKKFLILLITLIAVVATIVFQTVFINEIPLFGVIANIGIVFIEFKIKFNEFPELLDLIKSHKFFMYYLHIPKKMREYGLQKEDFFLMKK